jgi:ankyrin repeat protein
MTNNHFTNVEDLRSALITDNIQGFTLQVKLVDICFIETSFGQMCWDGHADIVRAFLEKKITTVNDIVSKIGKFTAVHIAALRGHVDVMCVLVDYGASIDIADTIQVTPLLYAVRHQKYDMVKYLIENGANVNAIDIMNHTPLYEATNKSDFTMVKYLIESGANVNVEQKDYSITVASSLPLYEAIIKGDFNIVKYLIENGAILHNALGVAIMNERPIIAKYIDSLQRLKTLLCCENDFQESVCIVNTISNVCSVSTNGIPPSP